MQKTSIFSFVLVILLATFLAPIFAEEEAEEIERTYTGGETLGIFTYKGTDFKVYIGAGIKIMYETRKNYFFDQTRNPNIGKEPGNFPRATASFVEQETRIDIGFTYKDTIESRIRWEVQAFWDSDSEESPITNEGLLDEDTKNDSLLALEDAWASIKPFNAPIKFKAGLQDFKITHSGLLWNTDDYGLLVDADYDSFYFQFIMSTLQESTADRGYNPLDKFNNIYNDRLVVNNSDRTLYALVGGVRGFGGDFQGYFVIDKNGYIESQKIENNYFGLSAKTTISDLTLLADLSLQSGKLTFKETSGQHRDRDISGLAYFMFLEYNFSKFRVHTAYLYGSGDGKANDNKYQAYLPIAQDMWGYFGRDGIWADDALPIAGVDAEGIFSLLGRDRIAGIGMNAFSIGSSFRLTRDLTLFVDLSSFNAADTGGLESLAGKKSISTSLGTEFDLALRYRYSHNFSITTNFALLKPGAFFTDYYGNTTKETANNLYLELKWRF